MSAKDAAGRQVTLDIHLLGRDYKVACSEHERAELQEAVAFLDKRMREIRETGKTAGVDRIAVMAALNIANDLLRERKRPAPEPVVVESSSANEIDGTAARRRIQSMHAAIDQALAGQEKLF
jgi:cell division protein ZapA